MKKKFTSLQYYLITGIHLADLELCDGWNGWWKNDYGNKISFDNLEFWNNIITLIRPYKYGVKYYYSPSDSCSGKSDRWRSFLKTSNVIVLYRLEIWK